MGPNPNTRPQAQVLARHRLQDHSITYRDIQASAVTYRDKSRLPDELWDLWKTTESKDRVLKRFGQMLEQADTITAVHLVSLWRHICCSAKSLSEDHEIERFNTFGSLDAAEVRF